MGRFPGAVASLHRVRQESSSDVAEGSSQQDRSGLALAEIPGQGVLRARAIKSATADKYGIDFEIYSGLTTSQKAALTWYLKRHPETTGQQYAERRAVLISLMLLGECLDQKIPIRVMWDGPCSSDRECRENKTHAFRCPIRRCLDSSQRCRLQMDR